MVNVCLSSVILFFEDMEPVGKDQDLIPAKAVAQIC